ncbi:hypothetical protein TWF281_002186 [Arthrobotrys megalospora]
MTDSQEGSSCSDRPLLDLWVEDHRSHGQQDELTISSNGLCLPYPVQHGLVFLRLVHRLRPFATDNDAIRRIRWDAVSDSLHRQNLFNDDDGWSLETRVKKMLYRLDDDISTICNHKIRTPYTPGDPRATPDEFTEFKVLLKDILEGWDAIEEQKELQKLGYSQDRLLDSEGSERFSEILKVVRGSMSHNRSKSSIWNQPSPTSPEPDEEIPSKVNDIRIDFLYHYNYQTGRRPEWLLFLGRNGISTIGDLGGWGPSTKDPYNFHRELIKALNKNEALREDIVLKEAIGAIGWSHIEAVLANPQPKTFQSNQPSTESNQDTPVKKEKVVATSANEVLIEDAWIQAIYKKYGKPVWLSKLNDNGIRTIGDLGGQASSDKEFQRQIKSKLAKDTAFNYGRSCQKEIELLSLVDIKESLDGNKRVSFQIGTQEAPAKGTTADETVSRKRKMRVYGLEKEVRDLREDSFVRSHVLDSNHDEVPGQEGCASPQPSQSSTDNLVNQRFRLRERRLTGISYRDVFSESESCSENETSESDEEPAPKIRKIRETTPVEPDTDIRGVSSGDPEAGTPELPRQPVENPNAELAEKSLSTSQVLIENNAVSQLTPDSFGVGFLLDYTAVRNLSYENSQDLKELRDSQTKSAENLQAQLNTMITVLDRLVKTTAAILPNRPEQPPESEGSNPSTP